jgi:hypothetical protein
VRRKASFTLGLFLSALGVDAGANCTPTNQQIYVLGSSFSWDAQPPNLENNPIWEIFCAKPIYHIFEHPYNYCQTPATPWPDVLEAPAQAFDYITFQPIPDGLSTQQEDIDYILYWMSEQPDCTTTIIHANWPFWQVWEEELHEENPNHNYTNHTVEYFYDLKAKLRRAYPNRRYVLTRSNEMLDYIYHDLTRPIAFKALFRDGWGHMDDPGRYLQHNAFRQAMAQQTGVDPITPGIDPVVRAYLDSVVALFPPQPAAPALGSVELGLLVVTLAGIGVWDRRRLARRRR